MYEPHLGHDFGAVTAAAESLRASLDVAGSGDGTALSMVVTIKRSALQKDSDV